MLFLLLCVVQNFMAFTLLADSRSSAAHAEIENHVYIQISDAHSSNLDTVIAEVLLLQGTLIIDPHNENIPPEFQENGFLLIKMKDEYARNLLTAKQGKIIGAYSSGVLIGYVLLTEIDEFMSLYHDLAIGNFDCTMSLEEFEDYFAHRQVGYIEQIAVRRGCAKRGVGAAMLKAAQELTPDGLVADVFIDPIVNSASLAFFSKSGFADIGILHQNAKPGFFAHQTRVFFWTP